MRTPTSLLILVFALASPAAADEPAVAFPVGYRDWRHVKSMVIQPGHALYESFGGIHHLYANALAVEGYRTGAFPDGAVIVFDLLEAATGGSAIGEGTRKVVGVMQRDAARFAATGGWGFEGFPAGDPARRLEGPGSGAACFGCHASEAATSYVFSRLRD
jgi:hypothetical protein